MRSVRTGADAGENVSKDTGKFTDRHVGGGQGEDAKKCRWMRLRMQVREEVKIQMKMWEKFR